MATIREVFAPADETADPGRVFYTIREADIRKSIIVTEIGPIRVADVLGQVQPGDVGKRLYRVPCGTDLWFWQAENDAQRDERLGIPRPARRAPRSGR